MFDSDSELYLTKNVLIECHRCVPNDENVLDDLLAKNGVRRDDLNMAYEKRAAAVEGEEVKFVVENVLVLVVDDDGDD